MNAAGVDQDDTAGPAVASTRTTQLALLWLPLRLHCLRVRLELLLQAGLVRGRGPGVTIAQLTPITEFRVTVNRDGHVTRTVRFKFTV